MTFGKTSPLPSGVQENLPLSLYRDICRLRSFQDRVLDLIREHKVPGIAQLQQGQEASVVGMMRAIQPDDPVFATYRGHGHAMLKGTPLESLFAEIMGRATGCCGGKGGPMHLTDAARGNYGLYPIVAGHLPLAAGAALAIQYRRRSQVVLVDFGDGSIPQGIWHETLNMAALWKLPLIAVCQNNGYAVSVPFEAAHPVPVVERARAFGIPAESVDGQDPLAVHAAVSAAADRARRGGGPQLVETRTYRFVGHSQHDPDGGATYRAEDEVAAWRLRDPLLLTRASLEASGVSAHELDAILEQARQESASASAAADLAPAPALQSATSDVYAAHDPTVGFAEELPRAAAGRDLAMNEALNEALALAMEHDDSIIHLGEDTSRYGGGGVFRVTKNLVGRFGSERIRETPISEAGFTGIGAGAALLGLRPVVEIMFADFLMIVMDQLSNGAAKLRYMSGGQLRCPLVVRSNIGSRGGAAAQHSQSPHAIFTHLPGLKVVMPSNPHDAKGLLLTALSTEDPVLFLENKQLYFLKGPVPEGMYRIPFGKAEIRRPGTHCTLVGISYGVQLALEAATQLAAEGLEVEVIDPRTLVPLDLDTIATSLAKTHRLVIVDEGYRSGNFGQTIAAEITLKAFDELDYAPELICAPDISIPYAPNLEATVYPTVEQIVAKVRWMCGR